MTRLAQWGEGSIDRVWIKNGEIGEGGRKKTITGESQFQTPFLLPPVLFGKKSVTNFCVIFELRMGIDIKEIKGGAL